MQSYDTKVLLINEFSEHVKGYPQQLLRTFLNCLKWSEYKSNFNLMGNIGANNLQHCSDTLSIILCLFAY